MGVEPVTIELRSPDGRVQPGTAQVFRLRPRERRLVALGLLLAGVLVGGLSILAPGAHLVFVWLAPVTGVVGAVAAGSLEAWMRSVSGTCPSCGQPIARKGPGPVFASAPTLPCPHCDAALVVGVPR
ncbi:MAG: hypothetical protein AAF602_08650 [Myxococcota bacterium]